jgi:heterodisulfide reductase subunit A
VQKCPVTIENEYDLGLGKTKAIHIPFESCVPNAAFIDERSCLRVQKGVCGICEKVCPAGAVDLGQKEHMVDLRVGAVVTATGYRQRDMSGTEYNIEHPNVITGLQLERMITPSGPTGGEIVRPSDGKRPGNITFIQCVGSRDRRHNGYCSNICCMYTAKNSKIIRSKIPDANINVCYIDIRAPGKMYEEYYTTMRENNIKMIMGIPSEIMDRPDGSLYFDVFDKATNKLLRLDSDLVILATSMEPSFGMESIQKILHIPTGEEGFLTPRHVKIAPVDTPTEGVFAGGVALGPKAIQECITDAGATASRVATLLRSEKKSVYLDTAVIDPNRCTGCGICQKECNYNAIIAERDRFKVVDLSCRSCGKCVSVCPENAITLRTFSAKQIRGLVEGILKEAPGSVIAYSTSACGYMAADIAGTSRREYPPDVKVIRLNCACQLSVEDLIFPFELGAAGILVLSCPEALHHYVDEVKVIRGTMNRARTMLAQKGITEDRIRLIEIVSPDGAKLQKVSIEIARDMKVKAGVA